MIALWMLYATLVGCLLAAAAQALEHVVGERGWPRRVVWLIAIAAVPLVPMLTSGLPRTSADAVATRSLATPPALPVRAGSAREYGAAAIPPNPTNPIDRTLSATARAAQLVLAVASLPAAAVRRAQGYLPYLDRLDPWLGWGWAAATSLLLGLYAAALLKLSRRRRRWPTARVDGQRVLIAPDAGPAVVGTIRPAIVLPAWTLGIDASHRALILRHEREHLRARDSLVLQLVTVTAYTLPWNAPVWWMLRRLRIAVELDCDRRVLRSGCDAHQYADLLLAVGKRRSEPGRVLVPALVERQSLLARRILAMCPDRAKFRRIRAVCAAGAAYVMLTAAYAIPMPAPMDAVRTLELRAAPAPDIGLELAASALHDSSAVTILVTAAPAESVSAVKSIVRPDARSGQPHKRPASKAKAAAVTMTIGGMFFDVSIGANIRELAILGELAGGTPRATIGAVIGHSATFRLVGDSLLEQSLRVAEHADSAPSRTGEVTGIVLGNLQIRAEPVAERVPLEHSNQIRLRNATNVTTGQTDSATFVLFDASSISPVVTIPSPETADGGATPPSQ